MAKTGSFFGAICVGVVDIDFPTNPASKPDGLNGNAPRSAHSPLCINNAHKSHTAKVNRLNLVLHLFKTITTCRNVLAMDVLE